MFFTSPSGLLLFAHLYSFLLKRNFAKKKKENLISIREGLFVNNEVNESSGIRDEPTKETIFIKFIETKII